MSKFGFSAIVSWLPAAALVLFLSCSCSASSSGPGEELVLVYTGQTESFLDVCGCASGQLGGVARRALAIADLRRRHPNSLLLDAGGLFGGDGEIDRLRAAVHLQAMLLMDYDAANVGVGELRFGIPFLQTQADTLGIPILSATLSPLVSSLQGSRVVKVNGQRVGIVGIAGHRAHRSADMEEGGRPEMGGRVPEEDVTEGSVGGPLEVLEAALAELSPVDALVILADVGDSTALSLARHVGRRGIVVAAGRPERQTPSGSGMVLGTDALGKRIGVASLRLSDGGVQVGAVEAVRLTEDLGEDASVAALVQGFYDRIATRSDLQAKGVSRLAGLAAESKAKAGVNGYVGAEACRPCHEGAYVDWTGTHHAGAFRTLQQSQKHIQPDCVSCHSTGLGLPTGYRIGKETPHLESVQCETCHGPGALHIRRPDPSNIRGTVEPQVCQSCHTAEQSPGFVEHAAEMFPQVNHTAALLPHAETAVTDAVVKTGERVTVELFVMAHCPYGMEAENQLGPMLKKFGNSIDFRLQFIADEAGDAPEGVERESKPVPKRRPTASGPVCESDESYGSGPFRSLHGDPEVEEGIRQTVVADLYPDRLLDYVICRNRSDDWQACALELGLDASLIAASALGETGERLFRENIRRANALGINASPTLRVNGREVDLYMEPERLARHICERSGGRLGACDQIPACGADVDCVQPDKVGVCAEPRTALARCVYTDPVPFDMTVVNDPACEICETGYFIRSTLELFPGARVRTLSSSEAEGRQLLSRYQVDRVPTFFLSSEFLETARHNRYARSLRPVPGGFLPDPTMFLTSVLLNRDRVDGRIDLFIGSASPPDLALVRKIFGWVTQKHQLEDLYLHVLEDGGTESEEAPGDARRLLAVQALRPDVLSAWADCRLREADACEASAGVDSDALTKWVEANADRAVETSRQLAKSLNLPPGYRPAALLSNRILIHPRVVDRVPELVDALLKTTGEGG